MAINISTNFSLGAGMPLDGRSVKETIAERDAIEEAARYVGMEVKVLEDGETYVLDGGVTNDCWVRKEAKSKNIGAYKWSVNSEASTPLDEVYELKDGAWVSTSKTLHDFEIDDYNGVWFYIGNGGDDKGLTRYKLKSDGYTTTGYDIDGADGYLNCRDYVIWNGRWVRFNVWEAKASTVKNADGKYSAKSGVQGLMSPTDKAYLTDLINAYWDKNFPKEITFHTEAGLINWISVEGLHYVTAQAGNGANPVSDNANLNYIIYTGREFNGSSYTGRRFQLAVHLATGRIFYRIGNVSEGGTFGGIAWVEVTTGIADGSVTTAKINNLAVTADKIADDAVTLDKLDGEAAYLTEGLKLYLPLNDGAKVLAFPYAVYGVGYADTNTPNIVISPDWFRNNPLSGTSAGAMQFTIVRAGTQNPSVKIIDISEVTEKVISVDGMGGAKIVTVVFDGENYHIDVLDDGIADGAVTEVKLSADLQEKLRESGTVTICGSVNSDFLVASDDKSYNGKTLDVMTNVRRGDAFTISEDMRTWWGANNPKPKAGDLIISLGDIASLEENWLVLKGIKSFAAAEERVSALEKSLNGISFSIGENGILTISKED